jgi:serine/threonine protein phosphatase PrpC
VSFRLIAGSATDVGRVRSGNEDAYLVDEGIGLIAVADGMGGHQAGEVASSTALEALRFAVTGGEALREAIVFANDAVWEKSGADEGLRGMGTTLTAGTMAAGGTLLIGHVGDSRAYLLREGGLEQVTSDHSVVAELIEAGELTEEQAELDPRRSMITRALGVEPGVDVDVIPLKLRAGDRVLLCSDGLTTMVREDEILTILRREVDPTRAAGALVDAANAHGGADNITTVVVDVVEGGDPGDVPELVDAAPVLPPGPDRVSDAGEPTAPLEDPIVATLPEPVDPEVTAVVEPAPPGVPAGVGAEESGVTDATTAGAALAGEAAPDAEVDEEGAEHPEVLAAERRADRRARRRARGRTVWRVGRWLIPILLIVGIGIGTVAWYARNRYFVGFDQGRVAVYRGVPGGLLIWDPTVERHTTLTASDLTRVERDDVRGNKTFSSKSDADAYVAQLHNRSGASTTTTSSVPTTTTLPGATTTTIPPTTAVPAAPGG